MANSSKSKLAGLDKKLDNGAAELPAGRPPGSLWKHPKTGGWYWRIKTIFLPADFQGKGNYTNIPLRQAGRQAATKTKTTAEAVRNRLWRTWKQTRPGGDFSNKAPRTLENWIEEFKAWNLNKGTAGRQVNYNVSTIRRFVDGQAIARCIEITEEAIQNHITALRKLKRSTRTIEAHRNTVFMFCRFLDIRGQLDGNPCRLVEVAAPDKRPPRYLTDKQIAAFLAHARKNAPRWLYTASAVALYSGLRLGEIIALCWRDVGGNMIVAGGSTPTKTADYRIVPMIPQLAKIFKKKMPRPRGADGKKVFPQHHKRTWGGFFADLTADLPVFGELKGSRAGNQWHLLRSTYAVQQARGVWTGKPASVWELMAWMGHKNPQTTMRYINIAHVAGMVAS